MVPVSGQGLGKASRPVSWMRHGVITGLTIIKMGGLPQKGIRGVGMMVSFVGWAAILSLTHKLRDERLTGFDRRGLVLAESEQFPFRGGIMDLATTTSIRLVLRSNKH